MDGIADRKYAIWITLVTVVFIQTLPCAYALNQTKTTPRDSSTTTVTSVPSATMGITTTKCGVHRIIPNGHVDANGTTYQSVASLRCNKGYVIHSGGAMLDPNSNTQSTTISCQANGTWSSDGLKCSPIACPNLTNPTNGNITYTNGTLYKSKATYRCHDAYTLSGNYGDTFTTCTANGKWSGIYPVCTINAGYSCHVVYKRQGQDNAPCSENGTWQGLLPDWILKDCGVPDHISNGDVYYIVTTVNSTASYSCHVGYELQGQHNITCLENGTWEHGLPYCTIKDCGLPKISTNGEVVYTLTNVNSTANFFCHVGFELQGQNNITCLEEGTWEHVSPDCILKDCGAPRNISNGDVSYTAITVNSTASYLCHVGYELRGQHHITCLENGTWENMLPYCNLIDCGLPPKLDNAEYRLIGNTAESSVVLYSCNSGYKINGTVNSLKCEKSGHWTDRIINCVSIACPLLNPPNNGHINQTAEYAVFTCKDGYMLRGRKTLFCDDNGKWSGKDPICVKAPVEVIEDCKDEIDSRNTAWDRTPPGQTASKQCPGDLEGSISRNCTPNGVWKLPKYSCVKKAVAQAENLIEAIESNNASDEVKSEAITDVLGTLSNSTKSQVTTSNGAPIYDGEIEKVTSILERIANISQNIVVTISQTEDFIGTTSNLLNPQNSESYKSLEENQEEQKDKNAAGADKVLQVIGKFVKAVAKSLQAGGKRTIKKDNMLMTVSHMKEKEDIHFPEDLNIKTSVSILNNVLKDVEIFSGILYHNLSGLLPTTLSENGIDNHNTFQINAAVMDMQLVNKQNKTTSQDFKINLSFDTFQRGTFESKCSFWNFNKRSWDTFGCHLDTDHSDSRFTTCICNHTTNFAILINPLSTPNVASKALDYISIIGCSISFISLVVTVVIHGLLWRYLKSDRAKILINLCVALILSYALFVGGVDRTENKIACTVIAVALHYIYLVVFFLMLSEGIEILMKVVFVFVKKSMLRFLLPLSWGLPIVIVGVSVGATRTEGYGSEDFCWLSVHSGLIWAFVGPALLVIVANLVLLSIVMKAMFRVKTLKDKERVEKVKTGVRCLCVLLPLTGGTWVIGVFYVNESTAWIQYVFAVLNSLQGLFIVLFHCILNTQVSKAISKRRKGGQSSTYPMSTDKMPSKPKTSSTDGKYTAISESAINTYLESTDTEQKYDGSREIENQPRQKSFAFSKRL